MRKLGEQWIEKAEDGKRYNMRLINGDCLKEMDKLIQEGVRVDMVLTSPPYDNLRDYGKDFTGWGEHIWKPCLDKIFTILKDGGVCVWVVNDATIKGSETGTSFKQALYWMEIGGNLHDTMIWEKPIFTATGALKVRYAQVFEYMFIFVKGKIKTFNPIKDRKNKSFGAVKCGTVRQANGSMKGISSKGKPIAEYGQRYNVWKMNTENNNIFKHPAPFPEVLAKDHILSWSNKNDTILDPFMGSGTTGKMCKVLNRNFIGIELDDGYFQVAKERIIEAKKAGVKV